MDAYDPGPVANRSISRRQALVVSGAGLTVAALAAAGLPTFARAQTPVASLAAGDFAGLVDIGGRSLYMETKGTGGPTVVFESGYLGRGDVWSRDNLEPEGARTMVMPGVAAFTHAVSYDRPGTIGETNPDLNPTAPLFYPSRSDPVPQPRVYSDIVSDLHTMLQNAEVPGPYVLVAHSAGGMMSRLYASTYPEEVVGMVLLDTANENGFIEFKKALSLEQWTKFEAATVNNPELLDAYPEAEFIWTAPLEDDPNCALVRQAQADSPLRPMPLVVLKHGLPFAAPFPGWPSEEMEQIMLELQEDLVALVPDAHYGVAELSGHNIHQDQPELVIEAVRQVVEAVRDPGSWTT
jgi:pimeloyl-ACP methyl ester carboxylesterase